jgi:hypothetical protein
MIDLKVSKLIDKHFPEVYKHLLNENGNNKIAAFECSRENELRLMEVHYENAKRSGLNAIGLENLIIGLKEKNDDVVFLINIKNEKYFFKLYFNKELHELLGYVILELRRKTEEEIRWARDVLGIKK